MTNLKRITAPFLASLAFCVAAFGTIPAADAVASDASPTKVLRSFAFESEVRIVGGAPHAEFSISTKGVFVAPSSQDCRAHLEMGALQYDEHAVIAGTHAYLDEGNGFEAVDASDILFRGLCPSDPAFWDGFPEFPAVIKGTPDARNGVKAERIDITNAASALRELMGDALPDGVTIDEFTLYLAQKGHWPVGITVRFSATTDQACTAMAGSESQAVALTAPCSVSRTVELSRPDDERLRVKIPKSAVLN
jgi:hypothetical protein